MTARAAASAAVGAARGLTRPIRTPRVPRLAYALFALYAVVLPWPNNVAIPRAWRLLVYNVRPYAVVAFVGIFLVGGVLTNSWRLRRVVRDPRTVRLAQLSLVFPALFLLSGFARGSLQTKVLGLYASWSLFVFVVMPALVRTRREVFILATTLAVVLGGNWLFAALFQRAPAAQLLSEEAARMSFSYSNPNYYSQLLQVTAALCVLAYVARPPRSRRRLFWLGVVAGIQLVALVFVLLARSRNVLVFMLAAGFVFLTLRRPRVQVWAAMLGLVVTVFVGGLLISGMDRAVVDQAASGRLSLWGSWIDALNHSGDPLTSWLFGNQRAGGVGLASYDELHASKEFVKFHVDNFYLEHLVESGLLGLGALLWPRIVLMLRGARRLAHEPARPAVAWVLAFHAGILAQGMFYATFPSFNAPAAFTLATLGLAPLLVDWNEPPRGPARGHRAGPVAA